MKILFLIAAVIASIFIGGKLLRFFQFKNEVERLFSESGDLSAKIFSDGQLTDLPEPVGRYFRRVLKNNQPFISYVRLTHNGQFKAGLDKDWANIRGEQYFTTKKPGFIWKGTTAMFTARDMYLSDHGRLIVTLFLLYNIVDGKGENYDEGELQRWVGESVWFPTNLLPGERIHWSPIDADSAKLSFQYRSVAFAFIVTFNEIGEITQMETQRFMGDENRRNWLIKLADYKELNDVSVPTTTEAIWKLETGEFSYAKFNVTVLEYDTPLKF